MCGTLRLSDAGKKVCSWGVNRRRDLGQNNLCRSARRTGVTQGRVQPRMKPTFLEGGSVTQRVGAAAIGTVKRRD